MRVRLTIDGTATEARAGDCLAAVLLRQRPLACRRHPVDGSPRAAFCMMGVCFDCLVTVDGVPDRQSCLITVRDGMRVERHLA